MIEELQKETGGSNRQVAHAIGLNYRTLLRWQKRASAGEAVLARPGPKKRGPLPLAEVRAEIEACVTAANEAWGDGTYRPVHAGRLPARAGVSLVAAVRHERNRQRQQVCKHVSWKEPNLAWALDATERERDLLGKKLLLHEVQDLCSRYRFDPLVALESKGEAVARHLEALFRKHGAPLFLKRDNGSALNHEAINEVLARHRVILEQPRSLSAVQRGDRARHRRNEAGPGRLPADRKAVVPVRTQALYKRASSRPEQHPAPKPDGPYAQRSIQPPGPAKTYPPIPAGHF